MCFLIFYRLIFLRLFLRTDQSKVCSTNLHMYFGEINDDEDSDDDDDDDDDGDDDVLL